jgi:predicted Zn-ribbon and HTH transcriptional regulator
MTTPPLCAGCGEPLRPDWIITPSLCERCEEALRQADTAWRPQPPEDDHDQPVAP